MYFLSLVLSLSPFFRVPLILNFSPSPSKVLFVCLFYVVIYNRLYSRYLVSSLQFFVRFLFIVFHEKHTIFSVIGFTFEFFLSQSFYFDFFRDFFVLFSSICLPLVLLFFIILGWEVIWVIRISLRFFFLIYLIFSSVLSFFS